jgi:hypothetical protein
MYKSYILEPKMNAMSEQELVITNVQSIGFEGQNGPLNVNDGRVETRWSYQIGSDSGNSQDAWILLDLGEEKTGIKSIGVHWYNPPTQMGRINTFEVQSSSDNAIFNSVMPRRQSEGKNELEIYNFVNEINARYVKLICYGNNNNKWVSINTIKINPKIDGSNGSNGSGTSDRFGIKEIYPTKPGTIELYMPDVQEITTHQTTKDDGSKVYDNGIYYQRLNRIRGIGNRDTRSNDMHFKKSMVDQEATGYYKFIQEMDDVDVKLRGGKHDDSQNSARCYIFTVKREAFQKECPHNGGFSYSMHDLRTRPSQPMENRQYAPEENPKFQMDFDSLKNSGRWVGFKGITINEGAGKVRCEMYIDTEGIDQNGSFDPNRQNWRLYYSIVDEDGKYGSDEDDDDKRRRTRNVWTTAQVGSTVQFRLDAKTGNTSMTLTNNDFKFLSVREIVRPS